MPDPVNLFPAVANSENLDVQREQRARQDTARAYQEHGIIEPLVLDSATASSVRSIFREFQFPPDPNFRLDRKTLGEFTEGLPPNEWDVFASARSYTEGLYLRESAKNRMDRQRSLGSLGFTGAALNIGASLMDPQTLAAGILTGGLGSAAATATKAGTAARLVYTGIAGAGVFGGLEYARSLDNPNVTAGDIATAAITGGAIPVVAGGLAKQGRLVRFGAGAAAAGVPTAIIKGLESSGNPDMGSKDVILASAINALMGGTFSALEGPQHAQMRDALINLKRDREIAAAQAVANTTGGKVELTEAGKATHADSLDPSGRVEKSVGDGVKNTTDLVPPAVVEDLKTETGNVPPEAGSRTVEIQPGGNSPSVEIPSVLYHGTKANISDTITSGKDGLVWLGTTRENSAVAGAANRGGKSGEIIPVQIPLKKVFVTALTGEYTAESAAALKLQGYDALYDPEKGHIAFIGDIPRNGGGPVTSSVGAAAQSEIANMGDKSPPPNPNKRSDGLDLSMVNDSPQKYIVAKRFGFQQTISRRATAEQRTLNNAIGIDPLPKQDGSPAIFSAPEWKENQHNAKLAPLVRNFADAYATHIEAARAAGESPMSLQDFYNEVGKYTAREAGNADPGVADAVESNRSFYKDLLAVMKEHNVKGSAEILDDAQYMPRYPKRIELDNAMTRFHEQQMVHLAARSLIYPDSKFETLQKIGKAWIKNFGNNDISEGARGRLLDPDQTDVLVAALRAEGMDEATIQDIALGVGTSESPDKGTPTRLRYRIRMNEQHAEELIDQYTGEVVNVSMEDFIDRNALRAAYRYADHALGQSAMAEVYRIMQRFEGKPITTPAQLMQLVDSSAKREGFSGLGAKWTRDVLDFQIRRTLGVPTSNHPIIHDLLSTVQNMNFLRVMSSYGSGLQNVTELSEAVAQTSVRASVSAVPSAWEIISALKSGDVTSATLKELRLLGVGSGRTVQRARVLNGLSPEPRFADPLEGHNKSALDKVPQIIKTAENITARGAMFASRMSGQEHGTQLITDSAGTLVQHSFFTHALEKTSPNPTDLALAGLNQGRWDAVAKQILAHSDFEDGMLKEWHFEKWDLGTAADFRRAIQKVTRRFITVTNPSQLQPWVSSPVGKILFELRKFATAAWGVKSLPAVYKAANGDALGAGITLVVAGTTAAIAYSARAYLQSLGMSQSQRRNYLDKMLSKEQIGKAAFSRQAISSLIPTYVDTLAEGVSGPENTVFAKARTTGLPGSAIFGTPTVDWLTSVRDSMHVVGAPFRRDYDFSREDIKNLSKTFGMPNAFNSYSILDHIAEQAGVREKSHR